MILFVAPYAGELPEETPFLAAAKKIRFLLNVLSKLDSKIVLLNSAHRISARQKLTFETINIGDGLFVEMVTPDTYSNPWAGRAINIMRIESIIDSVIDRYGTPVAAWFYNGYAFESRAALLLKKKYQVFIISEFEDWHFARNRGLNPKPLIDYYFWKKSTKYIDYAFAVNKGLSEKLDIERIPNSLLPGVLEDWVTDMANELPPFCNPDKVTIGYFGGLSREKGARFLLDLMPLTKTQASFVVTGKGELEKEFYEFAKRFPSKLQFLGAVSESRLKEAMQSVDVIVNAHQPNDGVFPFKILEAVASGRLLLSTPLPIAGYGWLKDAICFLPPETEDFNRAINQSAMIYQSKREAISSVTTRARRVYSRDGLANTIRKVISQRG